MAQKSVLHTIEPQSLVDAVVRQLESAIFSGELAPGTKLSEPRLAEQFGVSRGPLREAIRRLEGRRLVERQPNFGARVATLSMSDLRDLLVVREALEGMAARCAAVVMTDKELQELSTLLDEHRQQKEVRAGKGYYQEGKDFDFHFRIIRGSKNKQLIGILCNDLYDLLRVYRYKSSTLAGRARNALAEHEAIVAALLARDPEKAEEAMRAHLRNARTHIEQGATAEAELAP
jgi:DNA-binding GntR family transcriptional regulator